MGTGRACTVTCNVCGNVYLYQDLLLHAGVGQFRGLLADLGAEDH